MQLYEWLEKNHVVRLYQRTTWLLILIIPLLIIIIFSFQLFSSFYQQQQWDLQLRGACPIANVVPWHIVSVSHHQWWFIINNNFSFLPHLIIVVSLKKTWRRDRSPSRSKSWWFVMVSKLWNFWLGIFSLIIFCFVL